MKNLPFKKILFLLPAVFCFESAFGITDALKVKILQGGYSDEAVVRFLSGANGTYDGSYDSYKLFSPNPAVPNIFSKTTDGIDLAINAFPAFTASQSVDVYLRISTAGTYSITAEELGAFAPTACIMMKDLVSGALYYLRTTATYTVSLPVVAQTDPARFRIFFSYPATLQTADASCASCSDGQVTFNKPGESNWQYNIVNSALSSVAGGSATAAVTVNTLPVGNYVLTINSDFACTEVRSFFIGPVTYYTRASGNWEDASTWSTSACGGAAGAGIPGPTDNIVICSGNSISLNTAINLKDLTINGTLTLNNHMNLSGNLVNNGTLSAGTYTITLNGAAAQSIGGTGSIVFGSLVLNNSTPSNAVIMQAPVTVNGSFKLQDGHLLTTSSNVLTLGASATVILGANEQDSSFVKGPMKHTVNVSSGVIKIFPVGKDNSYRRIDLTIDQKTAASTTYMAEMIQSSAMALGYSLPLTLTNVSYVRYHEITQSPASTKIDFADVRIYFNCHGVDDAVGNLGAMSVAKDDGSGSWIDLSDTPSGYTCTRASYWGNALSGTFTSLAGNKFALGNTGTPVILPVSLTQFNASALDRTVGVSWSTASETNCDHFVIERSMDGESFHPAGLVKGSGNTSTEIKYEWADELPFPGVSFYRLKQVDINGASWYSEAVSVLMSSGAALSVFPNPAAEYCYLMVRDSKDATATVTVTDLNGSVLYRESFSPSADNELVKVDIRDKDWADGIYVFSVETNREITRNKIMVKRK